MPVKTQINKNITRLVYGQQKTESIIVAYDCRNMPGTETAEEVCVDVPGGQVTFGTPVFEDYDIVQKNGGEQVVRKTADGVRISIKDEETQTVRKSRHGKMKITLPQGVMFGLGNHDEAYSCLNGQVVRLYQENMRIAVPMFISSAGFAILIDNGGYMEFDFTRKKKLSVYFDSADCIDLYIITGRIENIYTDYRLLTGATPMLPKWSCGFIQSKERYQTAEELLTVVKKYRQKKIPLDAVVQDWLYWGEGLWGEKIFDSKRYPDPQKTFDEIHNQDAKVMISIWPNMNGNGENQTEFKNKNMLLKCGSVYNAFSEEARETYWKQAYEGLFKYGIDGWWCDSSEPYDANWEGETRPDAETEKNRAVAEFKKYIDDSSINLYSIYHSKGIFENQRKVSPKRVLNLTRSSYAGQHRYGTVVWSGDVSASWETLAKQPHIMQNYISTGEAFWNCDAGGFFVKSMGPWFWKGQYEKGMEDDNYKELFVRWLQFTAFTPMMRAHGTDTPREIWNLGKKGTEYYEAAKKAIELRYRLIPFFYSVNAAVTFEGKMPVQPLALAFNETMPEISFNQYMYGNELMVCPVTKPGISEMEIYLPKGLWYDFYTGAKYEGGKTITQKINLNSIPLFVKAGSIIPLTDVKQCTAQMKDSVYEIRVYPGASGQFVLYEDSGDGYDYEKGEYSRMLITYDYGAGDVRPEELGKSEFEHKYKIVVLR